MPNKKKRKKATRSKRTSAKKTKGTKPVPKKHMLAKQRTRKKKKNTSKTSAQTSRSRQTSNRIYTHKEGRTSEPERAGLRSGGQSGDLQSLPDIEGPDSESVDELLEEGNAFEADAVAGVARADDEEEGEVHTHEVPEDDVPEEYLDKD